MKIIIVDKTVAKKGLPNGGWVAHFFGKNIQSFGKTEMEALENLVGNLKSRNEKFIQATPRKTS